MKITRAKLLQILAAAGSVALVVYLALALPAAGRAGALRACTGVTIGVHDPDHNSFVTAAEIARELDGLPERLVGRPLAAIDTERLRRRLREIDKIESVDVFVSTNGRVNVHVTPLVPVARVFDAASPSYYINKDGKRITADARYHMDVPVLKGRFATPGDTTGAPEAAAYLPLLRLIASTPRYDRLVTMVEVDEHTGDVLLVPPIDGHVINIGDATDFESKMERLALFYREVMPRRGWDYYDTISVKWRGQVVATRRNRASDSGLDTVDDDAPDADIESMLAAEGTAPGQAVPGAPVKNDKPVPGAPRPSKPATTE